jgi:hypothetical protein
MPASPRTKYVALHIRQGWYVPLFVVVKGSVTFAGASCLAVDSCYLTTDTSVMLYDHAAGQHHYMESSASSCLSDCVAAGAA